MCSSDVRPTVWEKEARQPLAPLHRGHRSHLWVLCPRGAWGAVHLSPHPRFSSVGSFPSALLVLCSGTWTWGWGALGGPAGCHRGPDLGELGSWVACCRRPPRLGCDAPRPPPASVTGNPKKGGGQTGPEGLWEPRLQNHFAPKADSGFVWSEGLDFILAPPTSV